MASLLLVLLGAGRIIAAPAGAHAHPDAHDVPAGDPLDLVAVDLVQQEHDLVVRLRTAHAWSSRALDRAGRRSLCLLATQGTRHPHGARLCVAVLGDRLHLWRARPAPRGGVVLQHRIAGASVRRLSGTEVALRVPSAALELEPGRFAWAVQTGWRGGKACGSPASCRDAAPDRSLFRGSLARVVPVGCRVGGRSYRANGPRARRVVALTFDDGPAPITPRFLDVLERERVPATFFLVGREISGREGLLRRMLSDGFALGDHTMTHAVVSGGGPGAEHEVRAPIGVIRRASGYRPCLFRAPYGAVSGRLVTFARSLQMATIQWDVDPRDWSRPGSAAIESRILAQARPGSIILMHDGGGPRGQTLAALPHVIHALRARGYGFTTVPRLLGFRERTVLR